MNSSGVASSVSAASGLKETRKKAQQTPQRLIARIDLVDALDQGRTRLGLRLKLSHAQREDLVADASGDRLDAVLCLMQAAWGESMVVADGEQGEHAGGEGAMHGQMGSQDAVPVLHQTAGAYALVPGFEQERGGGPPENRQTFQELGVGRAEDSAALPGPGNHPHRRRPEQGAGLRRDLVQQRREA